MLRVFVVAVPQADFDKNHREVEEIEQEYKVETKEEFVQDAQAVTAQDEKQKHATLAVNALGFQCFPDGDRPADPETDNHTSFKHAHRVVPL